MSFFGKVFGGGKQKEKVPTTQEAIQELRKIEDMLGKKTEHLEKKIENEIATARKAGTKNKRVALQALKRKKQMEKQLLQIDGTLTTIEYQRDALENAATNTEVLKVMGFAADVLKHAHKGLDVDAVEDIMDDVQEQLELEREIGDAFSRSIVGTDIDEDELLEELEKLEDEEFAKEMIDVPAVDHLPAPPVEEPVRPDVKRKHEEDDDDIKELAQWAT